jgi:hypothetical protein
MGDLLGVDLPGDKQSPQAKTHRETQTPLSMAGLELTLSPTILSMITLIECTQVTAKHNKHRETETERQRQRQTDRQRTQTLSMVGLELTLSPTILSMMTLIECTQVLLSTCFSRTNASRGTCNDAEKRGKGMSLSNVSLCLAVSFSVPVSVCACVCVCFTPCHRSSAERCC